VFEIPPTHYIAYTTERMGTMLERIIRSEAHFASLLYCELRPLSNSSVKQRILDGISQSTKSPVGNIKSVFVEPAPFRDAWVNKAKVSDEEWRRNLVSQVSDLIDPKGKPVRTDSMETKTGRLRSPAKWLAAEISKERPGLIPLIHMFRARPDMLIITEKYAI
jgi:hypothetical protein